LKKIGATHKKSAAQVALRWILQHNATINTQSQSLQYLQQDADIFDFTLSQQEMQQLDVHPAATRSAVPPSSKQAITSAAALATAPGDCPGSAATVHASCSLKATFANTCNVVKFEVEARAKGSADGKWTDPHNKGVYTILNQTTVTKYWSVTDFDHLSGNKKYHDKVRFSYFDGNTGGCIVHACSESQVTSVFDFGTNYCNSHDLFCSDAGCHGLGAKLTYKEVVGSCSHSSGPFTKPTTLDCYKV
jgi:hypothetical protein